MRILCIGGTRFSGRAFSAAALAAGHELTLFHRGQHGVDLFPEAEHILGDRTTDLHRLTGRRWDAALDFCGFHPSIVGAAVRQLADSGWYGFISSISAHTDPILPGANEDSPIHSPPFPETDEITPETYGPLKVACEVTVAQGFPGRCAVVRPGFIVGPHDPSDRFPSLLRRAASGGRMLLPGPSDAALQFIDARDLAAFLLMLAESRTAGVFDVVHPRRMVTIEDAVQTARTVSGADTQFVWVDPTWLKEQLGEEASDAFPLWDPDQPGIHEIDPGRALEAGLPTTPLRDTIADTLGFDAIRTPAQIRHGLTEAREAELLHLWSMR